MILEFSSAWLQRKANKYTSLEIQNEMLQIMALKVLREMASSISKSDFFSIMAAADDCSDVSNEEQLALCFRWTDDDLETHEDFFGLYGVPNITYCRVSRKPIYGPQGPLLGSCDTIVLPATNATSERTFSAMS